MSKVKFQAAHEFIQEGRYVEARSILKTIDHPKAEEWLRKLDKQEKSRTIYVKPHESRQSTNVEAISSTKSGCSLSFVSKSIIIGLASIFGLLIIVGLLATPSDEEFIATREAHRQTIAPTNRARRPNEIIINDSRHSAEANALLDELIREVAPYGYISWYEAEVSNENRLIVFPVIQMGRFSHRATARDDALRVVEIVLRSFVKLDQETLGEIAVQVHWEIDGDIPCATGAGMGYRTAMTINWDTVTRSELFRIIDQEYYADQAGQHYSRSAWAPSITGPASCRN